MTFRLLHPDPFIAWLATRPAIIQDAARLWPFGSEVIHQGVTMHLIGWSETETSNQTHNPRDVMLILTAEDIDTPDFDSTTTHRIYMCARHFEPVL